MLRAGCVVVFTDHVDVVEAVQQHLAGPVGRGKIVGNILAVDAPGLVGPLHDVGHCTAGDELDRRVHLAHFPGEQIVLQLELRQRHRTHLIVAQGSLPTPQSLTPYGAGWPFSARHLPIGVVAAPLVYSTSSRADQASPKPALTVM